MARIHVLQGTFLDLYEVVVHTTTPGGVNAASVAWNTALVNSGIAGTTMTVGPGSGHITTAEASAVNAGNVFEGHFLWQNDPNWTNAQRLADLSVRATQMTSALQVELANKLRFFGATVS